MRLSLLALLLCASPAGAIVENPGTTAAAILQVPLGSRAMGIGGAFTAVASDVSALHYNPAGLSRLNAHELAMSFMTGLADNNIQNVAYGGPIPFTGISGNGYSSLGASVLFSQNGTIEVNRTNADGSFKSTALQSAGGDLVAQVGYAERAGTTPLDFADGSSYGVNHFLGASGKYIHSTLVNAWAYTFTADVGYLVNSPEAGLSLGLSALNLGGHLTYHNDADPLPTTLRAGVAYQSGVSSAHALTLAADADYLTNEQQLHANAGLEYSWLRSYGVRVGYQFLRDAVGLTVGFGLRWRSRVMLDYAWVMGDRLDDQQRFTLTWRFGGVAPALRSRSRQPFIEKAPDHQEIQGLDERTPPAQPAQRPRQRPERPAIPGWIY